VDDGIFLERLRSLIGRECEFLGRHCRLIEVLAEDGTLVLEVRELLPPIQTDQYGQALYRGPEVIQVPIFAGQDDLSDDLKDLLARLKAAAGA
jgi:hypothetical protein